jgi:hypothetical protein
VLSLDGFASEPRIRGQRAINVQAVSVEVTANGTNDPLRSSRAATCCACAPALSTINKALRLSPVTSARPTQLAALPSISVDSTWLR